MLCRLTFDLDVVPRYQQLGCVQVLVPEGLTDRLLTDSIPGQGLRSRSRSDAAVMMATAAAPGRIVQTGVEGVRQLLGQVVSWTGS